MDSLIKQMRVRFSNVGQGNPEESSRVETKSFKGEKKSAQNWLRRLFSRQRSGKFDPNTQMERAAAVAAAAYAINKSLEESLIPNQRKTDGVLPLPSLRSKSKKQDVSMSDILEQKKTSDGPEPSMSRQKSKKEDTLIPITEPGRVSKRFSGENETTSFVSPGREVPVAADDEKAPETFADEIPRKSLDTAKTRRTPSKVTDPGPSMKRTPTFADEGLNRTSSKKPEGAALEIDLPTRQADAWEKAEMDKIKEKYEKLSKIILSWEEKKKKTARRKFDKRESKLDKRRAKSSQKFRSDVETIGQIAGGVRAQAQERRRNEEFQAKEKASIIRTTGKVPASTCFCF